MGTTVFADQRKCEDFIECLSHFIEIGAAYEIERNKDTSGSDVVIKITPKSPEAASIDARLELHFGVYLLLGVSAQFEIPFSKSYYAGTDWIAELAMLCRAVASGNFQERLVYRGNEMVYSRHQLVLENGKTVRESWGIRPILQWRETRTVEHHYAAYGSVKP